MALSEGLVGLVTRREEPVNLDDAASHPDYVLTREIGEEPYHGFLGVPVIQHRKVLGVLVVRQKQRRCFDEEEETFLVTLAAQLAGAMVWLFTNLSGQNTIWMMLLAILIMF